MPATTPTDRLREAIEAGDLHAVQSIVATDRSLLHAVIVPGVNRNYRPLTTAALGCQLPILSYLIEQGCSVREDHNYPMFRAALYDECVPAMALLVANGADVNGVWDDYGPPIIASCESGRSIGCLRWLVENGALVAGRAKGARREVEWDAVVHAAYRHKEQPALLEYLLERGCDVNGRERGQTALHVLARRGDVRGVRLLLDKGVRASQLDSTGRPAIAVTRSATVRELLRSAGE